MFAQQELDSGWVLLFIDRWAHTCRSSPALAHLRVCSTRRAAFPLPRLQVRVGAFSLRARSQTPARCLFRGREGSNAPLLLYVLPMGCLFNQTSRFFFRRRLPRGMVAFSFLCMLVALAAHTLLRVCSNRRAVSSPLEASIVCKGDKFFNFAHSLPTSPSQARWQVLIHAWYATPACSLREGRTR